MRVFILVTLVAAAAAMAPLYTHVNKVPNTYIVSAKENAFVPVIEAFAKNAGAKIVATLNKAVAIETADFGILSQVRRLLEVDYVEEDGLFQMTRGIPSIKAGIIPWGQDRIDQAMLPLDDKYEPVATGKGVDVYIFATGIDFDHADFQGRAVSFYEGNTGTNGYDCWDGQFGGTSLAAIVGGLSYGVAKEANLLSCQVTNCLGQLRTLWFGQAADDIINQNLLVPAVRGIVLMGGVEAEADSTYLNERTKDLLFNEYMVIGGGGDTNEDATLYWPGLLYPEQGLIVTGSTNITDYKEINSNHGQAVELWAPGADIETLLYSSTGTAEAVGTGSHLAAAHTAGVAAIIAAADPSLNKAKVECELDDKSGKGYVLGAGGAPIGGTNNNKLLYVSNINLPIPTISPYCASLP